MLKIPFPSQTKSDTKHLKLNKKYILTRNAALSLAVLLSSLISIHSALASGFFSNIFGNKTEAKTKSISNAVEEISLLEAPIATTEVSQAELILETANNNEKNLIEIDNGVNGTAVELALQQGQSSSDKISVYEIREGDTINEIAKMFNTSANTIKSINNIKSDSELEVGETLEIFPFIGIKYTVEKGDSISGIAERCRNQEDEVTAQQLAEEILAFNNIDNSNNIIIGQELIIPHVETVCRQPAKKTTTSSKTSYAVKDSSGPLITGYYANPLPNSIKTQAVHGHNGVDLAGVPVGTSILASAAGKVIIAKNDGLYNGGYGNYVVIEHPNGTQTLYGHLHFTSVVVGQQVTQGQKIGGMGNTGRSTGPHLHFEVRGAVNPF